MNEAMPVSAPILLLLILLGYALGSIPFGYLLVRARSGGDVRAMGSGNIGATNVARTAGWSIGVATLLLDSAKGFFAVWLAGHFSGGNIRFMMYAGLAAILGHIFPVWLKFSGGKGVAIGGGRSAAARLCALCARARASRRGDGRHAAGDCASHREASEKPRAAHGRHGTAL